MLSLCYMQTTVAHGSILKTTKPLSSGFSTPVPKSNAIELYIPVPEDASREDAFQWHITTRNFFAFVLGKPLVGFQLSKTLIQLQERMQLYRSGDINNHQDLVAYLDNQGYMDFIECADYALAMLCYAEHYKLRDMWIDAFAHCVGMNESLTLCQEFEVCRPCAVLECRCSFFCSLFLG